MTTTNLSALTVKQLTTIARDRGIKTRGMRKAEIIAVLTETAPETAPEIMTETAPETAPEIMTETAPETAPEIMPVFNTPAARRMVQDMAIDAAIFSGMYARTVSADFDSSSDVALAFHAALEDSGIYRLCDSPRIARKCETGGATGVYGIALFEGKSKTPVMVCPLPLTRSKFAMGRAFDPAETGAGLYLPASTDNLSAVYNYVDPCGRRCAVKRTANGGAFARSYTLTRWVREIVAPVFSAYAWSFEYRGSDADTLANARGMRYRVAIVNDFEFTA